jgi:hypothetical protein
MIFCAHSLILDADALSRIHVAVREKNEGHTGNLTIPITDTAEKLSSSHASIGPFLKHGGFSSALGLREGF